MPTTKTKLSWGAKGAIAALVMLCVVVVLGFVAMVFGNVVGEEFNPYTFQRRSFYFYELPFVQLQVWPLTRRKHSGQVEQLVESQGYVKANKNAPDEWHLMSFRRATVAAGPFDAAVLMQYLDARDGRHSLYWNEWSVRNPEQAAVFWPYVARLSQAQLYIALPTLFDLARTESNVKTLDKELTRTTIAILRDHAERALANQEPDRALELITSALELDPKSEDLLKLQTETKK